jgi:hypothetical protein
MNPSWLNIERFAQENETDGRVDAIKIQNGVLSSCDVQEKIFVFGLHFNKIAID